MICKKLDKLHEAEIFFQELFWGSWEVFPLVGVLFVSYNMLRECKSRSPSVTSTLDGARKSHRCVKAAICGISQRPTAIKCAKEQGRMASPGEKEMRDMMMKLSGEDLDS